MRNTRNRLLLFLALAALLAVFAGCKSESPTAPPGVGGGGTGGAGTPPGGGVTPPTGATVTLTVSNANPLIDSISVITATVTENNQPVPNGTAVEFNTNLGVFTDTQDVRTIRTTTNGVATATLTSSEPGTATVSATVNNVTRTVNINFNTTPITPVPPSTAPTISSVTPNTGPPTGGTIITINGTNFRAPARVIIDAGPAGSKEAFVQSVTPTQIVAVTQAINLATTQSQAASITVIVDAGNPTEQRVTRTNAFTFVNPAGTLTPVIRAISPTSGPIEGGTRVTIIGDAFDANGIQVFFGAAQASVISVTFNQIIVTSPTGRDTATDGAGAVTGPVNVRVLNVTSGRSVTAEGGFRYTPKMQITLIEPNQGPFTGGTRFTIDGSGFNEPLAVTLAGVGATIIKVTGTQITGISNGVVPTGCSDVTGPVVVTNGDNGDTATGPTWIYRVFRPVIVGISGTPTLGGQVTITVANATDPTRIAIGGRAANIISSIVNPDGTTSYTVTVPSSLTLNTRTCPNGTVVPVPTAFDVQVTSLLSTCTDTFVLGLTVSPPVGPALTVTGAFAPFTGTIVPPVPPAVTPTVTQPAPQTITIVNSGFNPSGATPLVVNSVTAGGPTSGTGCTRFQVTASPNPPASLDVCQTLPVTVRYSAPVVPTPTPDVCTLTISTNAGTQTFTLTGNSQ
jgi:IPT/TIG domain